MLSVSGLGFRYGSTQVLHDIDFTIPAAHVVALIGPNGSGKSTLLKCINGVLRPTSGSIGLHGKATWSYGRRELARAIAYVPQQIGSGMALQVVDMIALGRAPHRRLTTKARDREIIWSVIKRLDLTALAFRPFGDLSGGQRQRVLIARALAQDANLVLMDEPTSNLDPYYQLETMSVLKTISQERGVAAFVALHDLSMAARFADSMILMFVGTIHARGQWQEVLTTEALKQAYGVSAIIGSADGFPYVLPVHSPPI